MDKLKMQSPDLVDENIAKIAGLFPNCITEDRNEKGTVRRAVDFDLLRQELSATLVEAPRERYTLSWPGKNEAILTANAPIAKTLRPCEEESVDFENTKNIFIEGDNLDALKLLQETYLNKVKMIYIDPPYNTGNDFIYEDDFAEDTETFLKRSNQKDEEGNRLIANTEANGRFHSDWLSMMFPRLKLARNLLRDDGVIFISIGDEEITNTRKICEEIFGGENFCGMFVWEKKKKPSFLNANMGSITDYILCYAKHRPSSPPFTAGIVEDGKKYPFNNAGNGIQTLSFPTQSVIFTCSYQIINAQDMSEGNIKTELINSVEILNGRNANSFKLKGEWRYSQKKLDEFVEQGAEIMISKVPFRPNYINRSGELKKTSNFLSHRTNGVPTNEDATEEIRTLFGLDVMSYPKPSGLLKYLISTVISDDDIVMDFFAGSSTTAHGLLSLNASERCNCSFIMVQLPENLDESLGKANGNTKTIIENTTRFLDKIKKPHLLTEIGKERIRRAGKKIKEESPITTENLDVGFRVFKVDTSNMKDVYYTPDELTQDNLELFKDHIKPDRRPEDLLFQVFIDWGLDLSLPIAKETIDGKTVFIVDTDALVACFDSGITEELVKKLAVYKPLRVVFRDDAFGSDSVKINMEQIFKLLSPATEVKSI